MSEVDDSHPGATGAADDPLRDLPRLTGYLIGDGAREPRFRSGPLLGAGGIGRVVVFEDLSLQREVAVKTLLPGHEDRSAAEALVTEARITASLEHPGIAPVHDLDISADGHIYYAMRRIRGRSLSSLVDEARRTGVRPEPIADANPLVTILIKVCDALAYAHSRGVIHRDLKPDNIMVGDFGEVLVLDWGASSLLSGARRGALAPSDQLGTPIYMSPEQARGEYIDARSDIWSLGATLFDVLFLRYPFDDADEEAFWRGKRAGTVIPPEPGELHALNRPLAAIALRAMRAEPGRRYQSVAEVAADLRAYQAGQAMVAYRGSPWERLRRWHRRWGRALWPALGISALVAGSGWVVWGERLKRIATWGRPIVAEGFADGSWRQRWISDSASAFEIRDQRLVSSAPRDAILWLRQPLAGPVAIEFDGMIAGDSRPCDLSVVWSDGPLDATHPRYPRQGWMIQAGAYDNSFCAINRVVANGQTQVARAAMRLVPGRTYRIRVELDGCDVRLLIDGGQVATYEDPVPIQPGHIGIYAYYPGKTFDDLRIYSLGVAERTSPIGFGDDRLYDGDYPLAIERYQRVLASHPTGALADEAWYKIGHCHRLAGDEAAAWAAWQRVVGPPYSDRVACHGLDRLFDERRHDELLARLPEVAARSSTARAQVESLWSSWADRLRAAGDRPILERYLAARRRLFAGSAASVTSYGKALNFLQRWDATVAECDDDPLCTAEALSSLGRPVDGMERFGRVGDYAQRMRREAGDLAGNLGDGGDRIASLCKLGRVDEALREKDGRDPWRALAAGGAWTDLAKAGDDDGRALALIALGRPQEAATGAFLAKPRPIAVALALLGRQAELERLGDKAWDTPTLRLIARLAVGDADGAALLRHEVAERPIDWSMDWPSANAWFGRLLLVPLLDRLAGDPRALREALAEARRVRERAGQRLWHLAGFIDGSLTAEQLMAQPSRGEAEAWLRLGSGIRADAEGDPDAARAAYRSFQQLPLQQRLLHGFLPDPEIERFVGWRLQALR